MKNAGIAVVCQLESDGTFQNVSFELLTVAKNIAERLECGVFAFVCGDESCNVAELSEYGAEKIFILKRKNKKIFELDSDVAMISRIISDICPSIVLFPATDYGRVLAPEVAASLQCGITADCTAFDLDETGRLVQIRPALGGNIMAHIISPDSRPQMATVRPSVFKKRKNPALKSEKIVVQNDFEAIVERVAKIREKSIISGTSLKIEDAAVVVSVGNGVASKELLQKISDFAEKIGAALACSRKLVEKGWFNQSRQVGQSGKTITPEIYFAIGISGAVQHIAGMKSSGFIISVNKDKSAEIFNFSDIGFVMDIEEWLDVAQKFLI